MRILVVDDNVRLRTRIADLLRSHFEPLFLGEAGCGISALEVFNQAPWDAVVLDLSLPLLSGLVVLTRLLSQRPGLPVVILSTDAAAITVDSCFRCGALGYVAKENAWEELVPALLSALNGQPYRCQRVRHDRTTPRTQP